eukprot:72237-Pleurochrysis_carterae.AAC.2
MRGHTGRCLGASSFGMNASQAPDLAPLTNSRSPIVTPPQTPGDRIPLPPREARALLTRSCEESDGAVLGLRHLVPRVALDADERPWPRPQRRVHITIAIVKRLGAPAGFPAVRGREHPRARGQRRARYQRQHVAILDAVITPDGAAVDAGSGDARYLRLCGPFRRERAAAATRRAA